MSKKTILSVVLAVVIVGVGCWLYQPKLVGTEKFTFDPKNCTYTVDGQNITLKDGYAEKEIVTGAASKLVTQYFGNEAHGDFNGDGLADVSFLFSQNSGGSGTFYYVAVALQGKDKCSGTNAILLGDRIAPQTSEFRDGEIIINYADRFPTEPMTARPSLGVSKHLQVVNGQLVELQK
jgi:hypothetical protein